MREGGGASPRVRRRGGRPWLRARRGDMKCGTGVEERKEGRAWRRERRAGGRGG